MVKISLGLGIEPAEQSDISELAFLDVVSIDKNNLYSEVIKNLNTQGLSEELASNSDLLAFYEEYDKFLIMEDLVSNISIELPYEPKKKLLVSEVLSAKLKVSGNTPEKAMLISQLLTNVTDSNVKSVVKASLLTKIQSKLDDTQRAYDIALAQVKRENEAEIVRLTSQDNELRSVILEKISVLKSKGVEELRYRIERLKSDLDLAKSLKIVKPMDPLEYQSQKKTSSQLRINGKAPSNYWKGSSILEAELASLESRESNDAYIAGLSDLNRQLSALKVNQRVELLKKRTDFVPFNEELRQLAIQKTKLEKAMFQLKKAEFTAFNLAYPIVKPTKPVAPKKSLILAVSIVLGLILGIFMALIRSASKKRKLVASD